MEENRLLMRDDCKTPHCEPTINYGLVNIGLLGLTCTV